MKRNGSERERESYVRSLVVWISSQPSSVAESERPSSGGGGRAREGGERMGMWERRGESGVSFSSVWPLSHSNSGLATWTPVPLSSPTAQRLTPSGLDHSKRTTATNNIKTKWNPCVYRQCWNSVYYMHYYIYVQWHHRILSCIGEWVIEHGRTLSHRAVWNAVV